MRLLKRQEIAFEYIPNLGTEEILVDGKHTGRYEAHYDTPVSYKGNLAMPTGYVQATWFGIDKQYSHILIMEDPNAPIKEEGIIRCKDDVFVIQAVRPSYNFLSVAMRRITPEEAVALNRALESQSDDPGTGDDGNG